MSDQTTFEADEWTSPHEWARMYRHYGFQVVPARSHTKEQNYKRPQLSQWTEFQNELVGQTVFDSWYGANGQYRSTNNMGLITGTASGGLLCVDLDVNDKSRAMEWWAGILAVHNNNMEPETVSQRTGGGGRQILFRAPVGYSPPTNKTSLGVDLRGQGGFMMCPPSMHASGKNYEWEEGCAPYDVEVMEAPDWLLEEIEALLIAHGGGTPTGPRERVESDTQKNDFGLDINGREGKIQRMVWARVVDLRRQFPIAPSQADQEAQLAELWQNYLRTTASRLEPREGKDKADLLEMEGRGWSNMERKWRYAMKKWDKEVMAAAAVEQTPLVVPFAEAPAVQGEAAVAVNVTTYSQPQFNPWERYMVPDFPLELLPRHLRDFVNYLSTSTGADVSACAMTALAACSGALDQEFSLKMKRSGKWYVKPRLWVMLVGDPSSKKSPVMSACIAPIRAWEGVGVKSYAKEYARWKEDKERQKEEPEPTKPTRYLLNEVTTEKLGEILSRQDRGIMVEQDEVSGWIGAMDKYSGGKGAAADRGFWLGAYNGGPRTVDRLGRGETFIQNLCVAFVGGVQPDRLAELGNLTSDGLLQRFLPVMMKRARFGEEVESEAPADGYTVLINELIRAKPSGLLMDEGAIRVTADFQRYLFELEGMDGLGKGFCGFAGKLSGIHGSLSLVLHMIEDPENSALEPVSERVASNAERIIREFCIPHAFELYRSTTDGGDWEGLRRIASFILTSTKDRFTASDFTAGVRGLRGLTLWEVGQKVSPLVAGGWLVEDDKAAPAKAWVIVNGLREALAERREKEVQRKSEVMEVMNSSLKVRREE